MIDESFTHRSFAKTLLVDCYGVAGTGDLASVQRWLSSLSRIQGVKARGLPSVVREEYGLAGVVFLIGGHASACTNAKEKLLCLTLTLPKIDQSAVFSWLAAEVNPAYMEHVLSARGRAYKIFVAVNTGKE